MEINDMEFDKKLNALLEQNAKTRVNGNVTSERTRTVAKEGLRAGFNVLRLQLGYKIQDPANLEERHIKALCVEWHRTKKAPKTIQGYLSQFRIFSRWIGKPGLVKDIYYYLPDVPRDELRVNAVARKSKSWAEMGIDVAEKVELAMQFDQRFGLMILAQVAFGLRRMEVLQMQPWKFDKGNRFAVYKTKGGRPREVDIDTEVQRAVLDLIKSKLGKAEHLGWKHRPDGGAATLDYCKGHYNYFMKKLGITKALAEVTGHGLRAQFAENAALLRQLIPPTLGGTGGQMARDDLDLTRVQVSEQLGHSRKSVTTAYYGSFGRETELDLPDRARHAIEAGFATIHADRLRAIPQERLGDCTHLLAELMAIGVYDDPRKVQILWNKHSSRHAVEWLVPAAGSNLASLEAAALSFTRSADGSSPAAQV
jgi:integrase